MAPQSFLMAPQLISCPGCGAAFFMPLRRAGTVKNTAFRYGPGSAARCAASGARIVIDGVATIKRSRHHHDQRLALLDNIGGEFRPVAAAHVLRRVDGSGRSEQDVAGRERHRRLAFDLILQRVFEDIDDL